MNLHKKENLWQMATINLNYFLNEQKNSDMVIQWDQTLNIIAKFNQETVADYNKLLDCISNAAFFARKGELLMTTFWLEQFAFNAASPKVQEIRRSAVQQLVEYRLSTRNPLVCAAYEMRASHFQDKRTLWLKGNK